MDRPIKAWQALDGDGRLAALAGLGLFVSMFLPWYQQNAVVDTLKSAPLQSRNLDAFQVFSFVEAAVLLVALAVLYLLFARAEGREFNMPGGDGTVVLAAGAWTALLLIFRLFDKPGISSHGVAGNVGVQWGIFFALAGAGLVTYAGSRMRAAQHPTRPPRRMSGDEEGPSPFSSTGAEAGEPRVEDRFGVGMERGGAALRRDEEPAVATPAAERAGAEERRQAPPRAGSSTPSQRARSRFPPAPSDQLSFEDPSERAG